MTMLRDYRMFTYEGGYTYRAHVRDSAGDTTGEMVEAHTTFNDSVVARCQSIADAWIVQRHNASYQQHENFEYRLKVSEPAPHMIMEVPY